MVGAWGWCSGRLCDGRMRSQPGLSLPGSGARGYAKAPPTRGRRGLLEVGATWLIFLASSQIHLEALRAHSCNQISVFSYPTN